MQQEYDSIPERLLVVRRRTGLSQNEFAEKVGVSPRAYRNYELAIRDVPVALVIGVHRAFNVSFNWLLLGEGPDLPQPASDVFLRILQALRDFQNKRSITFSVEKEARLFEYLYSQIYSARGMSDGEVNAFLETAA